MPHRTTLTRPRRAVAAAFTIGLTGLAASACGGGNQPTTPLTTTVTITPSATPSSPSTTSTPSTTTTPALLPPTTYAQAVQHFAAGKVDAGAKAQFTSPTGNIFCSIATGDVPRGCEVRDGRATPPPGTCDADGGGGAKDVGRIEWSGDTPKPICNSDTMFQPGAQVLQYGSIAQVQGSPFQCLSETLGMTCINTDSKKGFFLAKGAYSVF